MWVISCIGGHAAISECICVHVDLHGWRNTHGSQHCALCLCSTHIHTLSPDLKSAALSPRAAWLGRAAINKNLHLLSRNPGLLLFSRLVLTEINQVVIRAAVLRVRAHWTHALTQAHARCRKEARRQHISPWLMFVWRQTTCKDREE